MSSPYFNKGVARFYQTLQINTLPKTEASMIPASGEILNSIFVGVKCRVLKN